MVKFLANYAIPLLLITGVGIAILLWVLAKYLNYMTLTTANVVGVGCVCTGLALVMAGVLPLAGLQPYDKASYFYLSSGVLLLLYSLRLLWPLLSRHRNKVTLTDARITKHD